MSKFNKYSSTITKVRTHQGGEGVKLTPEAELTKITLTALMENTYYEKSEDLVKRMVNCVENLSDPDFALKLAVYAREKGLRSVNHALTAMYMIQNGGVSGMRTKLTNALKGLKTHKKGILWRPDEMGELLGAYWFISGRKNTVTNPLRVAYKTLIESTKWDRYSYSKYKSKGHIKLHDIVNLVHPKGEFAEMIINGTYDDIDTFEKASSKAGSNKTARKEQVQKMLDKTTKNEDKKGEMGDKAFLMNIGNMLEDGISQEQLIQQITNGTRKFKGIFPYEFIRTAWFAHQRGMSGELVEALFSKAVESFKRLPLDGKVAVLVDTSGSMSHQMSDNSQLQLMDVGAFYGAIAHRLGGELYAWASNTVKIDLFPGESPLRAIQQCRNANNGYGTNLQQALDYVKNDYDNVIVFSDMQIADYIRDTGKLEKVYCFDLNSYGTGMSVKKNILSFCGFDDSMFEYGGDLVNPKKIVAEINKIDLYDAI